MEANSTSPWSLTYIFFLGSNRERYFGRTTKSDESGREDLTDSMIQEPNQAKRKRFLALWSLISPGCLLLTVGLYYLFGIHWNPGTLDASLLMITIYVIYWGLLGSLQGALLLKFQYKTLAYKWLRNTSATGFLIMLVHDLTLLSTGINMGGQGVLILLLSLPIVAILGGWVLGYAQFLLLRGHHSVASQTNRLPFMWFVASFISWIMGFIGIFFSGSIPVFFILFAAVGGAIKGWAVMKYLGL